MNRFLIGAAVALSGMALGAAEPRLSFSGRGPSKYVKVPSNRDRMAPPSCSRLIAESHTVRHS